ncbi:RNA polymerase sigma factor [Streptomyces eurythermus]|uniref:RNA polymerase sigma factor n=1 Tax=Streptomyces eurythermus TaxID=42237 RepID=UPI0036D366C6
MPIRESGDFEWERLYRAHWQSVLSVALLAAGGKQHEAWDGVQHAFIQAWRRLTSLNGLAVDDWAAWLRKVAVRQVVRDRQRASRLEPFSDVEPVLDTPSMDMQVSLKEEYRSTLEVVARMPMRRRQALALHLIAGYSVAETASIMGVKEATVRSLVRQAREVFPERKSNGGKGHD